MNSRSNKNNSEWENALNDVSQGKHTKQIYEFASKSFFESIAEKGINLDKTLTGKLNLNYSLADIALMKKDKEGISYLLENGVTIKETELICSGYYSISDLEENITNGQISLSDEDYTYLLTERLNINLDDLTKFIIQSYFSKFKENPNWLLHEITKKCSVEFLEYFLSFKELNIDAKNNDGFTPLHLVAIYKDEKVVEVLIKYGANPKIKNCPKLAFKQAGKYDTWSLAAFDIYTNRCSKTLRVISKSFTLNLDNIESCWKIRKMILPNYSFFKRVKLSVVYGRRLRKI